MLSKLWCRVVEKVMTSVSYRIFRQHHLHSNRPRRSA